MHGAADPEVLSYSKALHGRPNLRNTKLIVLPGASAGDRRACGVNRMPMNSTIATDKPPAAMQVEIANAHQTVFYDPNAVKASTIQDPAPSKTSVAPAFSDSH